MLCSIPFVKLWKFVGFAHCFHIVFNRRLHAIIAGVRTANQLHSLKKEIMLVHIWYKFHSNLNLIQRGTVDYVSIISSLIC